MSLSPLGKLSKLQGEVKCKSKVFFFFYCGFKSQRYILAFKCYSKYCK